MSYDNVPDDWDSYWETCSRCGNRYHASEGGCGCEDYYCAECGEELDEDGYCPVCDEEKTMDPDATLQLILELASEITSRSGDGESHDYMSTTAGLGEELAEAVENLHEWITKGGFPPKAWQVGSVPEWISVSFATGTIWCRRCQLYIGLPAGPLKDAAEEIDRFVADHSKCQWDDQVHAALEHAQHNERCQLTIPGKGCNCGLDRLLRDMGQDHLIKEKRELHKRFKELTGAKSAGDYKGRLRHG